MFAALDFGTNALFDLGSVFVPLPSFKILSPFAVFVHDSQTLFFVPTI